MLIMSLIIDCMRRYIIQDCFCVSDGTFDDALLISILMFQVLPFTFSFRCHELHEITERKFFLGCVLKSF